MRYLSPLTLAIDTRLQHLDLVYGRQASADGGDGVVVVAALLRALHCERSLNKYIRHYSSSSVAYTRAQCTKRIDT